jgi:hypothetical protein
MKPYLKNVHDHVPLTTITEEIAREEGHKSVFQGEFCILYSKLQVIVGLV